MTIWGVKWRFPPHLFVAKSYFFSYFRKVRKFFVIKTNVGVKKVKTLFYKIIIGYYGILYRDYMAKCLVPVTDIGKK